MLPAVMRWNKPVNAERQALVAAAMGHPGEDASDALDAFIAGLGMPRSLGAVQVGPENFARIAEGAMETPWVPRNPGGLPGRQRCARSSTWRRDPAKTAPIRNTRPVPRSELAPTGQPEPF